MNSDILLVLILPLTAAAVWVKLKRKRRGAAVAFCYMLIVFLMTALSALEAIPFSVDLRILLLRLGWLLVVFDEVVTYIKLTRWSRKVSKDNGKSP